MTALALIEAPADAPDLRAELRAALAERAVALRQLMAAQKAAARASELADAADARVADFAGLDAKIAADAAKRIAEWADGEPSLEPNAKFAEQIRWRAEAQQKAEVARAALASLNASLERVRRVFQVADLAVGACASSIMIADAETIAQRLKRARNEVWTMEDSLNALAAQWAPVRSGVPRPMALPSAVLDIMANSERPWRSPLTPNPEAGRWQKFREALTNGDADAELPAT